MFQAVLATLAISSISLVGGLALVKRQLLSQASLMKFVSFAAGVMLAVSFLDLLPEAMESHEHAAPLAFALGGIIAFFVLEKLLHQIHCHHPHKHNHSTSILVLIGDGLHNFFDGVAIAASFLAGNPTGWLTTIAIAAHEIPQEIADFSVLIKNGLKPRQALLANFISALTAMAGLFVGFVAINQFLSLQSNLLALTAGMFLYIALADLIPELESNHNRQPAKQIIPFAIGLMVSALLISTTHRYLGADHSQEAHQEVIETGMPVDSMQNLNEKAIPSPQSSSEPVVPEPRL